MPARRSSLVLLLLLAALLASGCSADQPPVGAATLTRPPATHSASPAASQASSAVPTAQLSAPIQTPTATTQLQASPTIECSDGLEFVADLTVPDGTQIARGVEVDKRWQVKNSGTCNWDNQYRLVLIAGSELGLPKEQAIIPARASAEAIIRFLLTSPVIPGIYTSAWQARNPAGELFGDVIYIEIQIN